MLVPVELKEPSVMFLTCSWVLLEAETVVVFMGGTEVRQGSGVVSTLTSAGEKRDKLI